MNLFRAATVAFAAVLMGCSSQQLYSAGQASQRNECNRLVDVQERQRCIAHANLPHDVYQQQGDQAKQRP